MKTPLKRIFLSFVNDQFKTLAERLHQLLREAGFDVNFQPLMGQVADDTLVKLYDSIDECDLVVHIVGDNPGTTANLRSVNDFFEHHPRDEFLASTKLKPTRASLGDFSLITYTQWDAWIGLHLGKGLLVYVPQADCNSDKKVRPDFPQAPHLAALAKAGRHSYPFQDAAEIVTGVFRHFGLPEIALPAAARGRNSELVLRDPLPPIRSVERVNWQSQKAPPRG